MSIRTIVIVLAAITAISLVGAVAGIGNVLPSNQGSSPASTETEGMGTPAPKTTGTAGAGGAVSPDTQAEEAQLQTSGGIVTDRQAFILLNPATVRPGSSVGVTGSGFDAGAQIDFTLKRKKDDKGQEIGFVQTDKGGNFGGFSFTVPDTFTSGNFILAARQHDGKHETWAIGHLTANSPVVTFGTQVGKPGDTIAFSMKGFAPREEVKVYWNSLGSRPVATLQMDEGGGLLSGSIPVPFGAVGNNSFIFMGDKSQSPVTMPFLMLNLYPVVSVSSYAAKADTVLTFSGNGFGPDERIRVYLNSIQSSPIGIIEADDTGTFANAGSFLIPFELKGKNSFVLIGEQSQAPATVSFDVLPYTPYAEASTYGGRPGTTITFYGQGFARQEVVHVFVGRGQGSAGEEVTCAKTDSFGSLVSGGSYTIPHDARPGKLSFVLVGSKSKAEAVATMEVMDAGGPVPAPQDGQPQQPFQCPYTDTESSLENAPPAEPAPATTPSAPRQGATLPEQLPTTRQTPPAPQLPVQRTPAPAQTPTPATGAAGASGQAPPTATARAAPTTPSGQARPTASPASTPNPTAIQSESR